MKKVYLFLAPGFEEIEAVTPVDLLRRAGIECITVGIGAKVVEGAHKISVTADITPEEMDLSDADMVILPGGNPGYINLEQSEIVRNAIETMLKNDRYVAAICAAPSILGRLGVLKGKRATVYPGMDDQLIGAEVSHEPVVQDGKIITSRGAGTAIPFAGKLIEVLKGKKEADEVLTAIVYEQ